MEEQHYDQDMQRNIDRTKIVEPQTLEKEKLDQLNISSKTKVRSSIMQQRIITSRTITGVTKLYTTIPIERVGIVIGRNGETIKRIMDETKTKIHIDEVNGIAIIEPISPSTTPYEMMRAQDIIRAISYGFPPEKAFKLLEEDVVLIVIDLTQYVKDSENHLVRVKGRIIGEEGRARKNIEEMTGTYMSIYGDIVAIIGSYENANIAREAIMMLIEGRQHSTVYRYIDKLMRQIRRMQIINLYRGL